MSLEAARSLVSVDTGFGSVVRRCPSVAKAGSVPLRLASGGPARLSSDVPFPVWGCLPPSWDAVLYTYPSIVARVSHSRSDLSFRRGQAVSPQP